MQVVQQPKPETTGQSEESLQEDAELEREYQRNPPPWVMSDRENEGDQGPIEPMSEPAKPSPPMSRSGNPPLSQKPMDPLLDRDEVVDAILKGFESGKNRKD